MWRAGHTPTLIAALNEVHALWNVHTPGCPRDHSRTCGRAARRRAPAPVHTRKLHRAGAERPLPSRRCPAPPRWGMRCKCGPGGTWTITATIDASWRAFRADVGGRTGTDVPTCRLQAAAASWRRLASRNESAQRVCRRSGAAFISPYGPFADGFSVEQHSLKPFDPIRAKVKELAAALRTAHAGWPDNGSFEPDSAR
jgi:hypothetical protein